MKISAISVWQVDLPLAEPYFLSGGRLKFEKLDSTFVKVDTDEGLTGWGESCPWGHTYLPSHGPGVRAGIQTLSPHLLGCDPCALESINHVMDTQLPEHPYVKSAVDMACWDILGKYCDMPVWKLMGSAAATPVPLNSSISTGTPEQMITLIEKASHAGYRTHSAKIGGDNAAADIERIDAITAALSGSEKVTFDVNRAWTPAVAVQVLNSVASRDWVEQPCETLAQCAHIAGRVVQPIMLDECMHDYADHLQAWRLSACEGVKVKPNRLGGLTKAKKIIDLCAELGWSVHVEDVGGSALADTAAIHLAAATPDAIRLASWLCHYHLSIDPVVGQGARNDKGYATPPSLPGIGVTPEFEFPPKAIYQ